MSVVTSARRCAQRHDRQPHRHASAAPISVVPLTMPLDARARVERNVQAAHLRRGRHPETVGLEGTPSVPARALSSATVAIAAVMAWPQGAILRLRADAAAACGRPSSELWMCGSILSFSPASGWHHASIRVRRASSRPVQRAHQLLGGAGARITPMPGRAGQKRSRGRSGQLRAPWRRRLLLRADAQFTLSTEYAALLKMIEVTLGFSRAMLQRAWMVYMAAVADEGDARADVGAAMAIATAGGPPADVPPPVSG